MTKEALIELFEAKEAAALRLSLLRQQNVANATASRRVELDIHVRQADVAFQAAHRQYYESLDRYQGE